MSLDNSALCSLLKQEASHLFAPNHLFARAAKRYKYNEKTFTSDCVTALRSRDADTQDWLKKNVVHLGDKSTGAYLPVSAIYISLLKAGEFKKADKISSCLDRVNQDDDISSSETDSSQESSSDENDEPSPILETVRQVFVKFVKPQTDQAVANLTAPLPDGVKYTPELIEKNKTSAQTLADGLQKFEAAISR